MSNLFLQRLAAFVKVVQRGTKPETQFFGGAHKVPFENCTTDTISDQQYPNRCYIYLLSTASVMLFSLTVRPPANTQNIILCDPVKISFRRVYHSIIMAAAVFL